MAAPYPYFAAPVGAYAPGMAPPPNMQTYPHPTQPMYYPTPSSSQAATPAAESTGTDSALAIQANRVTFQGKGLLSWILAETGDGKTLVKGKIVRCNGWDGLLDVGDDDSDQSEDEHGMDHPDDLPDAEGGLEALVKAAARRNERKRKREERDRSLADHLNGDLGRASQVARDGSRNHGRWGIEIRINLRTMNGPVPSRRTAGSLQPSRNLKPAEVTGSQRSNPSAGNSARSNPANLTVPGAGSDGGSSSRAGSAVPVQQPRSGTVPPVTANLAVPISSTGAIASTITNQSVSSSNSQMGEPNLVGATVPALRGNASTRKAATAAAARPGRSAMAAPLTTAGAIPKPMGSANGKTSTQALPPQTEDAALAPALAVRRLQQSASKPLAKMPTSGPMTAPSIIMPAKTRISLDNALKTPPERPTATFGSVNKTPNAKYAQLPATAQTESTDPLRTPRQGANRKLLPSPKSSPATGLALAKSILRYPASQHTLELAQKLVGKEVFDSIVAEMGLQPLDAARQSPSKSKLSRLSESTNAPHPPAVDAQPPTTRARAGDPLRNPLLDPADQAKATSSSKANADVSSKPSATKQRVPSQSTTGDTSAAAPAASGFAKTKPKTLSCDHCKTTQTRVWRVKQLPGGKERRVCDACGLYFNNTKKMRPKELWGTQQIELPGTAATTRKQAAGASISKGKEVEAAKLPAAQSTTTDPLPVVPPAGHEMHASPHRKPRISTGNAPDSVNWTPRRSSRLNPTVDSSPTGRAAQLHHRPVLDEVCDAAMSPRRSTRLTPRKVSKGKGKEAEAAFAGGKAQKRFMELTKETPAPSPRRSLTSALTAVASGSTNKATTATVETSAWDDNDFSFLLSDNIDDLQDSGHFATDPIIPSGNGLDFEMEQFLSSNSSAGAKISEDDFDPNALLIAGEDHEPKFTQKEMELLVMLSASGIASEELGIDVDGENASTEAPNAVPGPSRQGNPLLDGNTWTDESSPWEISTPGGEQWKML